MPITPNLSDREPPTGLSPYRQHCLRWKDGCGSSVCAGARKVFARGRLPCDVLFVGEAPGKSEDTLGLPFVGPAGLLLDRIVAEALEAWQIPGTVGADHNDVRCAFTNLVSCIPLDPDDGTKLAQPEDADVRLCSPRFREFVKIASPDLIVCVGALSRDWLDDKYLHNVWKLGGGPKNLNHLFRGQGGKTVLDDNHVVPRVDVTHPAAILRANVAQKGLLVRRCVVTIRNAVAEHVYGEGR